MTNIVQTFGERLKILRKKLDLSLEELGNKIGMTKQQLSQLENDHSSNPPYFTLKKLSEALNTSVQFLIEGREYKTFVKFNRVNKFIPVLRWNEIISWLNYGEKMESERKMEYVCIDERKSESCFCLEIINDTMQTNDKLTFNQGEHVIVDPTVVPENGRFVLCLRGETEPFLRQLIFDGDKKVLKPLNERYPIEIINDTDINFLGVVIERRIVV